MRDHSNMTIQTKNTYVKYISVLGLSVVMSSPLISCSKKESESNTANQEQKVSDAEIQWQEWTGKIVDHINNGTYPEGIELAKKALDFSEKNFGEDSIKTSTSLNNLAVLYLKLGQFDDALPIQQRSFEIDKKLYADNPKQLLVSMNNIATMYAQTGKLKEALPLFKNVLEITIKEFGEVHPKTAEAYKSIGHTYEAMQEMVPALENYQKALTIAKTTSPNAELSADIMGTVAIMLINKNQFDTAMDLLNKALVIYENSLGKNHYKVAAVLHEQSFILFNKGKYKEAKAVIERGYAINKSVLGENHPRTKLDKQSLDFVNKKLAERKK